MNPSAVSAAMLLATFVSEQVNRQVNRKRNSRVRRQVNQQVSRKILLYKLILLWQRNSSSKKNMLMYLIWKNEQTENDIKCALQLNFKSDPRYVRGSNAKVITLHSRKQFTPEERALTILLANGWGYQDITKNCDERGRIGKAACQQMSFDCGYKKPIQGTQLHVWLKHLQDAFISGEPKRGLELRLKGSQKVLDRLEQAHSGYVRELFLYAKQKCGRKPTFAKLATVMIARSADPQEERPTIVKLQRKQVGDWYKANKDAETELVTNDPSNFSEEAEAYNSHDEFDL